MNKRLLLAIGFTALCTSSVCLACLADGDTAKLMDNLYPFNAGPYMGLALGVGGMDTPKLSTQTKHDFPLNHAQIKEGITGRIFGGYLWGKNEFKYGAELGGILYPENRYDLGIPEVFAYNYKYKGYAIDLLAVAKYYFNRFCIEGKAGGAYVSQKFDELEQSFSTSKTKILPELAGGIGYSLGSCEIELTYAHLFGKKLLDFSYFSTPEDFYKNVASVDTLMVGLTYYLQGAGW